MNIVSFSAQLTSNYMIINKKQIVKLWKFEIQFTPVQ